MNTTDKLHKFLLLNHKQKPLNIIIHEYKGQIGNREKVGYNSTYKNALELEKRGIVKVVLHDRDQRCYIHLIAK